MTNLRYMVVEGIVHCLWCTVFSLLYLLFAWLGLSVNIIAVCFPMLMFYSLFFYYDKVARYFHRKFKVVFRV